MSGATFCRLRPTPQRSARGGHVSGATVTVAVIADSMIGPQFASLAPMNVGGVSAAAAAAPAREVDPAHSAPEAGPACSATDQFAGSVYQLAKSPMHFDAPGTTKRPPIRKQRIRPQNSLISTPAWFRCPRLANVSWAKTDLLHYSRAQARQQAILVASNGLYSFKGSGYVRGGIFDRFEVIQGDTSIRFRDCTHARVGGLQVSGRPSFTRPIYFASPRARHWTRRNRGGYSCWFSAAMARAIKRS